MEYNQPNAGQGLGTAGLVLGIIALITSFIPCTAIFAHFFGIIGIILSIIGLSQASQANASKGLIIAALVVSLIGTSIAGLWGLFFAKIANEAQKIENYESFDKQYEGIDEAEEEFNMLDSIDDETMQELEKDMEMLENAKPARPDTSNVER